MLYFVESRILKYDYLGLSKVQHLNLRSYLLDFHKFFGAAKFNVPFSGTSRIWDLEDLGAFVLCHIPVYGVYLSCEVFILYFKVLNILIK